MKKKVLEKTTNLRELKRKQNTPLRILSKVKDKLKHD